MAHFLSHERRHETFRRRNGSTIQPNLNLSGKYRYGNTFALSPYRSIIHVHFDPKDRWLAQQLLFIGKDDKGHEYRFKTGIPPASIYQEYGVYQYVKEPSEELLAQKELTLQAYFQKSPDSEKREIIPLGKEWKVSIK